MILDVIDEKLIIRGIGSDLKPRHKSQLNDWGFSKNVQDNYLWVACNINNILPKVLKYFDKSNIIYSLTDSCKHLIDDVLAKSNEFRELLETGRKFKNGTFNTSEFKHHLQFLADNIPRKLKDHQIKATFHLSLVKNGANFSVPGSGKTTVVLSVYEKLRLQNEVNTLFVVGPSACFWPWINEFESVIGKKPSYQILAGGNKFERKSEYYKINDIYELYLITFQTLLNDQTEVCSFLNNKKVNAYLVIDEAHYIKQISGNWASSILNLSSYAKFKCVLTGTPMPKSYSDLYNMFDFLWPENNTISSENRARLQMHEERGDFKSAGEILESAIGPLFYRVRKSDLGLKPQIFHDPIIIQMNHYERRIYDAIVNKIRNYTKEDYLKNIDLIIRLRRGRMIRLRQCISYAKLLSTAIDNYNEDIIKDDADLKHLIQYYDRLEMPAKIKSLIALIAEFSKNGEKVVVWANFIKTILLIENSLNKEGYYCKKIIGETPFERTPFNEEETREKIRNEFVNKKSGLNILIANPAACAESISLHKTCHNAIYYDLSYNCAQYLQSLDRIHRVGGSEVKSAYYYFLQYANTIDSDILSNLRLKAQKMYDLIEGDYNIYSLDMFDNSDELAAYQRLFL